MTHVYYESDADLSVLKGKKVAVIGFGSQGGGQSQNLRDSGVDVVVGLRPDGKSWQKAKEAGMKVATVEEAAAAGDVIAFLFPDHLHSDVYNKQIKPGLKPGKTILMSHGFSILYNQVVPPRDVDVIMVAPKGPGALVRRMYTEGAGVPALIAVEQDYSGHAKATGLAYAKGIGASRAGVIETTFREETESDLFGEQTVLCGGVSELVKAGFDTLVEAGYQPEIAYYEVCNELKLIVDLIFEGGIKHMRYSVSDTARYGDITRGKVIINQAVRENMKKVLHDIQSGAFAREWILENQANRPGMNSILYKEEAHPMEKVGAQLRAMMPWLGKKK